MENRNPEQYLRQIEDEKRGQLRIFFGYAPGVGKTYAMLKAAQFAKKQGMDVVIGYVEPHLREETTRLTAKLEEIPKKIVNHGNIELNEFDIDAALARKPRLIIVDELAHTNAPGSRHKKRYQDIIELLKAGIDVYTTLNVQHLESLNDVIENFTGVTVQERIPNYVFDEASQVSLVDIEPIELIERVKKGKVYQNVQAKRALNNFFNIENLISLRELALRVLADRINKILELQKKNKDSNYFTGEHILVCISSSPTNSKVIRTAARMAAAFKGRFTALYIESKNDIHMSSANRKTLQENLHLAQQFGAKIDAVMSEDIALSIAEYAKLSNVSKVVIGRSRLPKFRLFSKMTLVEKLTKLAPNLDIYVIPVHFSKEKIIKTKEKLFSLSDMVKMLGILFLGTVIGLAFKYFLFDVTNIILIYLLAVFMCAIVTNKRIYSFISSILSVLIFNFFFTTPYYSLEVDAKKYLFIFLMMFIVSMITSHITQSFKNNAYNASKTAYHTQLLLETNQLIQKENTTTGIFYVLGKQLKKLLDRNILIYPIVDDKLGIPYVFSNDSDMKDCLKEKEKAVAFWVYHNNDNAGATTNTFKEAKCFYLALRKISTIYGVVGIQITDEPLNAFEKKLLLSILFDGAIAIENIQAIEKKNESELLAKNEQLRANLLRSLSHDLRTPLTSIHGNASLLLSNSTMMDENTKKNIYNSMSDNALWMIQLVENLLSITKIEDGTTHLNLSVELVEELIDEAIKHVHMITNHYIHIDIKNEFLMVKVDARLMMQVIINIVQNAIKYTKEDSNIYITCYEMNQNVVIDIADDGEGISEEEKNHIFEMFYIGNHKIVDSKRSLGLGLALCKSIITLHQGEIEVLDHLPHGALFKIKLPKGSD